MTRAARRAAERADRRGAAAFIRSLPLRLERVPRADWPTFPGGPSAPPLEVWRSRSFVVQVYDESHRGGLERISVQRTDQAGGITWDQLQQVKAAIGRGHVPAVELYPPEGHIVAVANMRHLWTLASPPEWAWKWP